MAETNGRDDDSLQHQDDDTENGGPPNDATSTFRSTSSVPPPPRPNPGDRMNRRCNPCIERGPASRCNKTWPTCAKCTTEGTERDCFGGGDLIGGLGVPEIPSRASSRSRAPPGPSRQHSPRPPGQTPAPPSRPHSTEPRRSESPGRPSAPSRGSRVRSPSHDRSQANPLLSELDEEIARLEKIRNLREELGLLNPGVQPHPPAGLTGCTFGSSGFTPLNAGHDLAPRQRPAIVPGQVAEETIAIVPDAVRKLFANGWTSYVPLTYLTDEYCEKVDEHHKLEPVVRLDTSTGQWVRSGDQLPDRSEASMSFVKWTRAWQRLLGILESINHPDRDRWLAHTQIVMNRPTIEEEWPLWVRYCIAVRKRSLQDSFDPGVFQLGIYATVRRIYDRDRADASSLAYINAELARRTTTSTQPPPRAGPNQPFPTVSPSSRAPRQPGARARSNHSPSVCFVCGSREHLSITCSATSLASGKPLLVSRTSADAAWTLSAPATVPRRVSPDPRKIVTPLRADAWERSLTQAGIIHEFADVPIGLREGFRLGVSSSLLTSTIHPNHQSATTMPDVIDAHIATECTEGRYTGPFDQPTLTATIGHFDSSPLGTVDKPSTPGAFRIIQDFSFPRVPLDNVASVNSEINSDDFPCVWGFFPDIVQIILGLPPGAQAATFDVDSAYRRMPVHPQDQPHIVVGWKGHFWVDHCVPFGAASSNGIFGRCGDALMKIFNSMGYGPVTKWVDDFLFFRIPTSSPNSDNIQFAYNEDSIYELANQLGWPWKPSKTRPFSTSFRYIGFDWDIPSRHVSIPLEKRLKVLAKIQRWRHNPVATLKETESLLGSLIHCALAVPEGRSHVVGLARFTASFSHAHADQFIKRTRPARADEDAVWWSDRLQQDSCGFTLRSPPPPINLLCHMDASTSYGIGVILGASYAMWELVGKWTRNGRNIGWAEIVAVELALSLLIASGVRDASVVLRSDNQGVIGAIRAGRSRNDQQNLVLQRIVDLASKHNIHLTMEYVQTEHNLADAPSRGIRPIGRAFFHPIPPLDPSLTMFVRLRNE